MLLVFKTCQEKGKNMRRLLKNISILIIGIFLTTSTVIAEESRILEFGSNLNFGSVNIGESVTKELTLYNRGNSPLTIEKIRFHEKIANVYSGNYAGVILAGKEQNVTITFTPESEEDYVGLVYIESDRTNGGDRDRFLKGSGKNSETKILEFGSNLNFGSVNIGESVTKELTLYNRGNSPLTIEKIRFHEKIANVYSGNYAGVILAGKEQNVTITFTPESEEDYVGLVYIESDRTNGGDRDRLLRGSGLRAEIQDEKIERFGQVLHNKCGWTIRKFSENYNKESGTLIGDITCSELTEYDLNSFTVLKVLKRGGLYLAHNQLENVDGLINLISVDEVIDLSNNKLTSIEGLKNLRYIGYTNRTLVEFFERYPLYSHESIYDYILLSRLDNGSLYLNNNLLTNVNGLNLSYILGSLNLSYNKLVNVDGLSHLYKVGREMFSEKFRIVLASFFGELYGASLYLNNNSLQNVEGLRSLHTVRNNIYLNDNNLTNLNGLQNLTNLGNSDRETWYVEWDDTYEYTGVYHCLASGWEMTIPGIIDIDHAFYEVSASDYSSYDSFVSTNCYHESYRLENNDAYSSSLWGLWFDYIGSRLASIFTINNNPKLKDVSAISNLYAYDGSSLYIDSSYDIKAEKDSPLCKTYWRIDNLDFDNREKVCNY